MNVDFPCKCGLPLAIHSKFGSTILYSKEEDGILYDYVCEKFKPDNLKYLEQLYEQTL
jgi:hypothetical protein